MQDLTLYNAYTNYLTLQRTTKVPAWQPSYNEFYRCLSENANLLDAANQAKAKSTLRRNSSQLCLYNNDVENNAYYDLLAFVAQHDGPVLEAYLSQRGPCPRRYPPPNKHALRNDTKV